MLALGLEQERRGGRLDAGGGQGRATVAWQSTTPSPGSSRTQDPGISIRQKISQWEGRSQDSDDRVKPHAPVISRTLSGDVLGNGVCSDRLRCGSQGKASLSKAKSLGLDFRETEARDGHTGPGRKSDPSPGQNKTVSTQSHSIRVSTPSHSSRVSTPSHSSRVSTPSYSKKVSAPVLESKPFSRSPQTNTDRDTHTDTNTTSSPRKRIISSNGENKVGCVVDIELDKPSSPSVEDHEGNMPPGNFYTCRGFWRRMEGDRLFWDKGRNTSSDPPQPPPKPQRTFRYQGMENTPDSHWIQWDKRTSPTVSQSNSRNGATAHPPSLPPNPCPVTNGNGFSRHKKNRKSFEYEDVVRLTSQQGTLGSEARRSELYHAYSDDNIYEDIICEPYEDVKLSPMCLPIGRARPWTVSQRANPHIPKLPPKPKTLRGHTDKAERRVSGPAGLTDTSKPAVAKRPATYKALRLPQYVNKIHMIFDAKRGRKRVKSQGGMTRDDNSGTESDPEDAGKGGSRRSVYVQSTLKRRPGYRTLERDLLQLQQQQLFQHFVVVSLRKTFPGNTYSPEITQQFPNKLEKSSRHSREAEDRLKAIPRFCFPDPRDWCPSADMPSETFSFVLTGEDGSRWFCYCRKILPSGKGKRLPEVHCIVSRLGCFNLFAKILEEVERRREISPPLVCPFMRSVMEAPFPAPGRTITVRSYLPGTGNEVLTLCRPVDSRLEHVDFESLLQCLGVGRLLQVFASLLLERRVIFIADKLSVLSRCGHAVLALLYPFVWQHTFVPVLPASMLDISCSPTPFLIGALAPCLPQLLELPIEEVLIVDLCADKFVVQLNDEDCILPSKLQAALQQILEDREHIQRQDDGDCPRGQLCDLSSLISEAFVRFFVELVGHYSLHMAEAGAPGGGFRELQRESFRKSHPSRGVRQFLQLFMDTQMFAGFIHDREQPKGGGRGLFEVRTAEYLDSNPEPEPSGVNKFLKGLGSKIKFLQNK